MCIHTPTVTLSATIPQAWTSVPIPNVDPCYAGGVRVLNSQPRDQLWSLCQALSAGQTGYKDEVLWQSCYESNVDFYHQNFKKAQFLEVACPDGLTMLTGLKRSDQAGLPKPNKNNTLGISCAMSSPHFCLTSMQDCCKPSCAWSNKVPADPQWSRDDTCDVNGMIWDYQ